MVRRLLKDVRYGVRVLCRRPGFTAGVTLVLALGLGMATAVFSVIDGVILKPLPYGDPARTVAIWSSWRGFPETWVSWDEYEAYEADVEAFSEVAIAYGPLSVLVGGDGDAESVQGAAVSHRLLPVLGVTPAGGRNFAPGEDRPGSERVALIGHDLWHRRFAADPDLIGQAVEIGGEAVRVIGVLPSGFRLPEDYENGTTTEVVLPLAAEAADFDSVPGEAFAPAGGSHTFYAYARLRNGATVAEANAQLGALAAANNAAGVYPASWDFRAHAKPLPEEVTGELHPALLSLGAGVLLVLAIACANVSGLMLMRGELRRREFGIRAALGARPASLTRQALVEVGLLVSLAGLAGIGVAWLALRGLLLTAPDNLPRLTEIGLDGGTLAFAASLSLATAFLVGVVPAWQAVRAGTSVGAVTGQADRPGRGLVDERSALVVAEIALAVVLVAGAGLMARTVSNLLSVDPGFETTGVVTAEVSLPSSQYPQEAAVSGFFRELEAMVAALPTVEAAGTVRILPLATAIGDMGVTVDGYQPEPGERTSAEWQVVSPGYFETMNIALASGRLPRDGERSEPAPLVVNEAFAARYFSGREAIGRTVTVGSSRTARVVGVVSDTRHNDLTSPVKPRFYIPPAALPQRTMQLVARSAAHPEVLVGDIRRELRSLDPRLALGEIRLMAEVVAAASAPQRFALFTLSAFGLLALVIGLAGIQAVLGYLVSRRMREIGIRMSLGATRLRVFGGVLRQGLVLTAAGIAAGSAAALGATRLVRSLLVDVSATDPRTYVATALLFLAAGALACLFPALRAMSVEPRDALRYE